MATAINGAVCATLSYQDETGVWHKVEWPLSWGYPVRKTCRPTLDNLVAWVERHERRNLGQVREARIICGAQVKAHYVA